MESFPNWPIQEKTGRGLYCFLRPTTRISSGAIHFSICFGYKCLNAKPVALMPNAVMAEEIQEESSRCVAWAGGWTGPVKCGSKPVQNHLLWPQMNHCEAQRRVWRDAEDVSHTVHPDSAHVCPTLSLLFTESSGWWQQQICKNDFNTGRLMKQATISTDEGYN